MNLGGTIRLNRTGVCILIAIFILIFLYISSNKSEEPIKNEHSKDVSLRDILKTAIEAAKRGGTEIKNLKEPLDIKIKGKTKEGVDDSVTNADFKSHCVMYNTLKLSFPNIRIISEENHHCEENVVKYEASKNSDDNELNKIQDVLVSNEDVTIWIDPLDATKEYTENLHQYVTTMVCVAIKGKPIIGVIHKPFSDKTSWAWINKIHSSDLQIPNEKNNDEPKVIIISISHAGKAEESIKKALGDNVKVISAAGAGYKSLEVASGTAAAYYHTTSIKKWDICAGNAIINALGGKMTTSFNDNIDYSNTGTGKVVNDKGLLATIYNHDWFIEKLAKIKGNNNNVNEKV